MMSTYRVSVLKDGEFKYEGTYIGSASLMQTINDKSLQFDFIVVDCYNIAEYRTQRTRFACSKVYLGGYFVKRYYNHVELSDIEKLKKSLNILYKEDGTTLYYPDRPFTTDELIDMLGGWFETHVVRDRPPRMAVVHYDWKQFGSNKPKVWNGRASKRFKFDLFGDVFYVNENCIS